MRRSKIEKNDGFGGELESDGNDSDGTDSGVDSGTGTDDGTGVDSLDPESNELDNGEYFETAGIAEIRVEPIGGGTDTDSGGDSGGSTGRRKRRVRNSETGELEDVETETQVNPPAPVRKYSKKSKSSITQEQLSQAVSVVILGVGQLRKSQFAKYKNQDLSDAIESLYNVSPSDCKGISEPLHRMLDKLPPAVSEKLETYFDPLMALSGVVALGVALYGAEQEVLKIEIAKVSFRREQELNNSDSAFSS